MSYTPGKHAPKANAGGNRDAVPAGKYVCSIAHVERSFSQGSKARLGFQFRILAGEHKNRMLFDDCYLQESAFWKLDLICAAVALTETFDLEDPVALIDTFAGKKLWVTWREDDSEWTDKDGKKRTDGWKVTDYKALDAALQKRLDDEKAAAAAGTEAGANSAGDSGGEQPSA